jgi:hypothetical protein
LGVRRVTSNVGLYKKDIMTKIRKIGFLIIAGLLITIGIYYFFFHSEFMKIDSCLDAGGRWIESEKRCVQK